MPKKWQAGDHGFWVESNRRVSEVKIVSSAGGFCVIHFVGLNGPGTTRVRSSRIFETKEAAEKSIIPLTGQPSRPKEDPKPKSPHIGHWEL